MSMENLQKVIGFISEQAVSECREIVESARDESERIRAGYYQEEQDEYWKAVNAGSKEMELRRKSLDDLAAEEANKQIEALHNEMCDEAMMLAVSMFAELPEDVQKEVMKNNEAEAGLSAEEFVLRFKDELSEGIIATLFE